MCILQSFLFFYYASRLKCYNAIIMELVVASSHLVKRLMSIHTNFFCNLCKLKTRFLNCSFSVTTIYISVWWLSCFVQICSRRHKVRLQVNWLPPTTNLSAHQISILCSLVLAYNFWQLFKWASIYIKPTLLQSGTYVILVN